MTGRFDKKRTVSIAVSLLCCFVVPFVTVLLVFKAFGMAPFGNSSVMIMDMSGQYSEFFCGLKHILTNGGPWFSWGKNLGGSYIGVFAYYVSSPLSFITLFWPDTQMPVALLWLTVLKIALSGATMGILLEYLSGRKDDVSRFLNVFLASSYALMSYNFIYSMSLMWLDGVIWLPIVILGAELLFRKGKMSVLTASLTVLFLSNYYISYMAGLFAALWVLCRILSKEYPVDPVGEFVRNIGKFALSVLIAAGLDAWILIPTWFDLKQGKGSNGLNLGEGKFYNSLKDLLPKLFLGEYDSITNTNAKVFLYCGAGIIVLTVLYFVSEHFTKENMRRKLPALVMTALLIFSAIYDRIDLAWHIFQKPNWFPFRWSFVIPFWFVILSFEAVRSLKKAEPFRIAAALFVLVPFFSFAADRVKGEAVRKTAVFALIYLLIIYAVLVIRKHSFRAGIVRNVLIYALVFVMCAIQISEMKQNGLSMIKGLDGQFHYEDYDKYVNYKTMMNGAIDIMDSDREENGYSQYAAVIQNFYRSYNEAIGFGYRGMSHYSSAYDKDICSFYSRFGLAQGYLWNISFGSTALTDSLFGVTYALANPSIIGMYPRDTMKIGSAALFPQYTLIGTSDGAGKTYVYRNDYALTAPYVALGDIDSFNFGANCFESQNNLMRAVSGDSYEYFTKVPESRISLNKIGNETKIWVMLEENQVLYAYFTKINGSKMSVDGGPSITLSRGETSCIQTIGMGDESGSACISLTGASSNFDLSCVELYVLNLDALSASVEKLRGSVMQDAAVSGSTVSGTVESDGGTLITSIPYDSGWTARVDGRRVQTSSLKDGFLTVEVPAGKHEVTLSYMPEGSVAGIVISLICAVGIIAWLVLSRRRVFDNHL